FGPDSGVAGLQRTVLEGRPVFAHGSVELVGAMRVDAVVDAVDPFDVGTELGLAAEVDGDVHTESARHRHRVDQPGERRTAGQGEVVALGVVRGRDLVGRHAGDLVRELGRVQAGGVDDGPGTHRHRLGTTDLDLDALLGHATFLDRTMEGEHRAALFGVALQ